MRYFVRLHLEIRLHPYTRLFFWHVSRAAKDDNVPGFGGVAYGRALH